MKKHLLVSFVLLSLLFSIRVNAQYCGNSGPAIGTPNRSITLEGFYPPDDSFPCAIVGVPYDTAIQAHTPAEATSGGSSYPLKYIIIDTISNLPCGMCWATDTPNNQIDGNATRVVRITGTTYDAPGIYVFRIIVAATVTVIGIPVTEGNQNLSSQGLHFELRVRLPNDTCVPVDTLAVGNTASTPGAITPPTISGSTSICSGTSTILTAGGANYYAYAWSNGTFSQSVHVTTPGTYTVTVYDNCNSATASVNVTNASITAPTITPGGPTTFCQGGNVSLNAGSGYTAYAWSNGSSSQTISAASSGHYTCTVTQNGCTAASDTVDVSVTANPAPTIAAGGPTTFCQGDSVLLNPGSGFTAYTWSNGATTQNIEAKTTGNYKVTVTQSGCTGSSNTVTVTVNNPTPTVTSSGPVSFCTGGADTLNAGSGYTAYLWSNTATTQTIRVTQTGNYTCTVTQSGCQGVSNTINVVVGSSLNPAITSPSLNICTGSSTTLDAGAGYNVYAWSNGATTETTTVSAANTYTVTVTQGGCQGTASATVNVGNFPLNVSITPAGPVTVCAGTPVTFDAGAGYTSYSWSNAASSETIQPTSTGTYSVTVSQSGCTGNASVSVTFNALPQATITSQGPLSVCAGGTVTLDAGSGFASYNWSNGATTETTMVSTAETYYVTVTNSNSCSGSDSAVVTVSPPPVPVIVSNGAACSGQPGTLSTTETYSSYLWSTGETTATITVTNTGSYTVSVTASGCNGSSAPYNYTNSALPVEYVSQTQTGTGSALLQVSPTGPGYQWLSQQTQGGAYTVLSSTAESLSVTCSDAAVYYTAVVTQSGCNDTAAAIAVICTGIDEIADFSGFSLKPNPASDLLYVSYQLSEDATIKISVLDLTGRIIYTPFNQSESKGVQHHEIKISDFASGIYLLNFSTDKGSFNTKFVKQ